jgi:hypothetical protein
MMASISGSFSSPGLSDVFTPPAPNFQTLGPNGPHAPFSVTLSGDYTGAVVRLAQSVNGGDFALMFEADGRTPLQLYSPGTTVITPSHYCCPGETWPAYQLSCAALGSGVCQWQFSQ